MGSYAASGVNYDVLDAGKRAAVAAALATSAFAQHRGAVSVDASRGEPAFLFKFDDRHLAVVMECLGTKSTIARQYQEASGENRFADIAYDSVAAIVNDIVCVGALPLVVNAYFATGSSDWYSAEGRFEQLVEGWRVACQDAGATWGGGESPGLSGIIQDTEIDLAGCAVGAVPLGIDPFLGERLSAGDEIVLVESGGLHTNGASLVRMVASNLPEGYLTKLPSGRNLGASVLDRSIIYAPLIESLLKKEIVPSYVSHITGHGFRKLMRADRDFSYVITRLPDVPELFQFLIDNADLSRKDAYGIFNMGAGFAIYCRPGDSQSVIDVAKDSGLKSWRAGQVEEGKRSVVIEPLDCTYSEEHLQLR